MAVTDPVLNMAIDAAIPLRRGFVAEKVYLPSRPEGISINSDTGVASFTYYTVDEKNVLGVNGRSLQATPGQPFIGISSRLADATGTAKLYGVSHRLPREEGDGFEDRGVSDIESQMIVPALTAAWLINLETLFTTKFAALSTYGLANTTASDRWSDASSDLLGQIVTGVNSIQVESGLGYDAVNVVMTKAYWDEVIGHPQVLGKLPSDAMASIGAQMFARIVSAEAFGFDDDDTDAVPPVRVHISTARYDSAADGASESKARIWANGCLIYVAPPTDASGMADVRANGFGKNFQAAERFTERYETPEKRLNVTETSQIMGMENVNETASYFITGAIAAG